MCYRLLFDPDPVLLLVDSCRTVYVSKYFAHVRHNEFMGNICSREFIVYCDRVLAFYGQKKPSFMSIKDMKGSVSAFILE